MASGSSSGASTLIELGIVGAPFGVRGWVKLRSDMDPPERLLDQRQLHLQLGGAWKIVHEHNSMPIDYASGRAYLDAPL